MCNNFNDALIQTLNEVYNFGLLKSEPFEIELLEFKPDEEAKISLIEDFEEHNEKPTLISYSIIHPRMEKPTFVSFSEENKCVSYEEFYKFFMFNKYGKFMLQHIADTIVIPF